MKVNIFPSNSLIVLNIGIHETGLPVKDALLKNCNRVLICIKDLFNFKVIMYLNRKGRRTSLHPLRGSIGLWRSLPVFPDIA